MPETEETSPADSIPNFDPKLMNEALDAAEPEYAAQLERHRQEEDERAKRKAEELRSRTLIRKVIDILVPV
jgi:hypothetical protein